VCGARFTEALLLLRTALLLSDNQFSIAYDDVRNIRIRELSDTYVLELESDGALREIESAWFGKERWESIVRAVVRTTDIPVVVADPRLAHLVPSDRRKLPKDHRPATF
jgi:hypothetical protein